MRLSLLKGAQAVLSSAAWQEIRVRALHHIADTMRQSGDKGMTDMELPGK